MEAAQQLHARGINHGDLYAHNILHRGAGDELAEGFPGAPVRVIPDPSDALARMIAEDGSTPIVVTVPLDPRYLSAPAST